MDRLDDLLCLPILRTVLELRRGERKSDSRDELREGKDSPDIDMAGTEERNESWKLRRADGPIRFLGVENGCGDLSIAGDAGGDMCYGVSK